MASQARFLSEDEIMLGTVLAMIPGAAIGMSIAHICSAWLFWKN
jgi:hypothetical protein